MAAVSKLSYIHFFLCETVFSKLLLYLPPEINFLPLMDAKQYPPYYLRLLLESFITYLILLMQSHHPYYSFLNTPRLVTK